jgi:hypothetical protein
MITRRTFRHNCLQIFRDDREQYELIQQQKVRGVKLISLLLVDSGFWMHLVAFSLRC